MNGYSSFCSILVILFYLAQTHSSVEQCNLEKKDIQSLIQANNELNLKLLQIINNNGQTKNVFFSPYSMLTEFSMLLEGARGETEKELREAFHFGSSNVANAMKAVSQCITSETPSIKLEQANGLFVDSQVQLLKSFSDHIKSSFSGEINSMDFSKNAVKALETINDWVKEHTSGKITNLFPPGSLGATTRLVLANALYFKGKWNTSFDNTLTEKSDFYLDNGESVKCDMMFKTSKFNNYHDRDMGAKVLEIPYAGGAFNFVAVIPDMIEMSLSALVRKMSPNTLTEWLFKLNERSNKYRMSIDIFLPKFALKYKMDLTKTLPMLGVKSLFQGSADLSGINGKHNLYVNSAFHKSFVTVDEEGAEASAATGTGMAFMSAPPQIILNRPFLYFIIHRPTGMVLFSGNMLNPTQG